MKNFKTSCESKTTISLKEIIQPSTRNFRTEIYRNIQTFAFQVFQERSSWTSKMVQCKYLFLTPTIKMFLAVLREYNFYNVECVEVRKMRFFEQNCIVEWVISFASFCWFWDFVTVLGHFNQCNFKIFCRRPTMVSEIFTQPPYHKKAS